MKVTVNMPDDPKGKEMEVNHLGLFKNGSTTEVDDEAQLEHFRVNSGLDKLPAHLTVGAPVESKEHKDPPAAVKKTAETKEA